MIKSEHLLQKHCICIHKQTADKAFMYWLWFWKW